jgi:D-alanyl-lipoteichoic acid acyltransferase DltB (MBOAT superfamily)
LIENAMLFHTWEFVLFFGLFYAGFLAVRRTKLYLPWLLAASYVFYAWWHPAYLILIIYSTALDYYAVAAMERSRRRKLWLWISIANNLALLGFFKYGGFATANVNELLTAFGVDYALAMPRELPLGLKLLLPVGISFYTFQSMSYTIDFYRGEIEREKSFIRFATFVALFPQLVAGPIERAAHLLPQLRKAPAISRRDVSDGLSLFVVGLFKKLALADYLAQYVERVYAAPDFHDGLTLLAGTFVFAWQIYFDFSGYTDMARGIARMMGIDLMLNFRCPYLATDLGDFWNRWHISLSTWFRDYVYIPLGGNRHGAFRMYRNIFLAMVISGVWHGAAWTFVIWGVLHAVGRMATRPLERSRFYRERVPRPIKQAATFAFVCLTWIFFRAENVGDAFTVVTRIFTTGWSDPQVPVLALLLIVAVWLYQHLWESRVRTGLEWRPVRLGLVVLMILYLFTFASTSHEPFIYFQF